ncbi:MAG: DNA translocase FtsK 4TM domain-containing protein [Alphaproteobacteria bacterium]|nr:DNA translocase FtsK 4TM domain-containing protein [Alphaproteobacteria bacterium]
MARSRKIKRPLKSKKKSIPFLPESFQRFVARRLVDSIALIFVGLAFFLFAAFISYNSADPSWNTASTEIENIKNYGSYAGAWVSDILLQTLGAAAFVLPLGFLYLGMRILKRQKIKPVSFRFAALLLAALLGSVSISPISSGGWGAQLYLGGSAGTLIMNTMTEAVKFIHIPYDRALFSMITGILAISSFLYAAAFSRESIRSIGFRCKIIAFTILASCADIYHSFYEWVQHYNDPDLFEGKSEKPKLLSFRQKLQDIKFMHLQKSIKKHEEMAKPAEVSQSRIPSAGPEIAARDTPVIQAKQPSSIPVIIPKTNNESKKNSGASTAQQKFSMNDSGEWEFPPISIIEEVPVDVMKDKPDAASLRRNAELLRSVLDDFGVKGDIVNIYPGPVVTLYELEPAPGTKSSKVISLSDDIARSMSAVSVRCAVVPGRNVIGIELPNKVRQTVYMREMLSSRLFEKTSAKLPLILGKDIGGQPVLADLAKMPHLLVAGTTGSGKSVAVNTMIMSLLYRLPPEQCRFIMIDPKMLELSVYDNIPHLLSPVVTEPGKAVVALKWAVMEMENRYRSMSKLGVRNIEGYNKRIKEAIKNGEEIINKVQTGFDLETGKPTFEDQAMVLKELPYIVIIVDEFADLMLVAGKDVENAIQRLAQMARAAGLHLIMATQRPSVDVITGVIKANFPTRISFQVTSKIDSRTILGDGGAEQLLGMGDMLYMAPGGRITRVHGPFVSDKDVEKTTKFLRAQATPEYLDGVTDEGGFDANGSAVMSAMFGDDEDSDGKVDELYDKAVAVIAREGKVSTSFIQRHLQIGYNRAARIVEEMERQGVISPPNSSGKREILVRDFSDV